MEVISSSKALGCIQAAWRCNLNNHTCPFFLLLSESLLKWNHVLFVLFLSDELDNEEFDAVLPVEEK
jgi:hypothetical protein